MSIPSDPFKKKDPAHKDDKEIISSANQQFIYVIGIAASIAALAVGIVVNGLAGLIGCLVDIFVCFYLIYKWKGKKLWKRRAVTFIFLMIIILRALNILVWDIIIQKPPRPSPSPYVIETSKINDSPEPSYTDTPVPPTNTPVPPTNTPVPPTNTPVPPTDTPVPPTPSPTPTPDYQHREDYIAPKGIPTNQISPGTTLKVVKCSDYITLRDEPDGNYGSKVTTLKPNQEVEYLRSERNGFYYISSGKYEGYALAAYLVPADSIVFKGKSSNKYDSKFEQSDLFFNDIMIGETTSDFISGKFGGNYKLFTAYDGYIWEYSDQSFIFDLNGRLVKVIIFGSNAIGPRQIATGMYMTEALGTILYDSPSISNESNNHDLILYSDKEYYTNGAYAAIMNSGNAGNGIIKLRDSTRYACMDISIKNSVVTQISVYMNE